MNPRFGRKALQAAGLASAVLTVPSLAATLDKADNSDSLNQTTSWAGGAVPGANDIARWAGLAGANSVSLGADLSWRGLTLATTGGPVAITGGNTLTLGAAGIDMGAATQDLTISSNLTLGPGNQVWNIATGRALALNTGTFTRGAGATLSLQGAGSATSTMTGMANDGSSGGGLIKYGTVGTGSATRFLTLNGSSLTGYTGATASANFGWTSGNPNTNNYDVAGTGGALGVGRSANTVRYTGAAATQSYGSNNTTLFQLNALVNAGSGTLTLGQNAGLSGIVAGTGSGAGELFLYAANAGITVSAPIYNSGATTTGALTNVTNGSTATAVTINGPNTVTFTGANAYTGGTNINSGKLVATSNGLNGGGIHIASGATLTFTGNNQTSTSTVTGSGAILNDSANTILITGNHSGFSGSFTHNAAANNTQFNSANSGSQNASYTLGAGELIFAANGDYTVKMGSLASAANQTIRGGNSATGTTTLEVGNLNTNTTLLGSLNNGGTKVLALNKVGSGTLTLAHATNSLSGGTTVTAGTLLVNGSLGAAANTVNVTGGTLGGSGSIAGAVNVSGSGSLAAGTSIESLVTGAVSMGSGTSFIYEAADKGSTGADLVAAVGPLSLDGVNLDLSGADLAAATWGIGDKLTLISYTGSGITSGFNGFADDSLHGFGANQWLFNYNDTIAGDNFATDSASGDLFVTMTMVPEPSAALLGGLGLFALLRRRR